MLSTSKRAAFALAFAMCLILGGEVRSAAEWKAYPFGASGDAPPAIDGCSPSYLVGFVVRKGAWFDKIGVVCGRPSADGKTWSRASIQPMRGGDGGGAPQEFTCAENEFVRSVAVNANDGLQVRGLRVGCGDLSNRDRVFIIDANSASGKHDQIQYCGAGEFAVAAEIHYGRHVNAIGLRCAPAPKAQPAPPPPAPVADRPVRRTGTADPCDRTATMTYAYLQEAKKLKCPFLLGPRIADFDRKYWVDLCKADPLVAGEQYSNVKSQYMACKASLAIQPGSAGPSSRTATAKEATDVYADNTGNAPAFCTMNPGDVGIFLAAKPGDEDWVNLKDISGECAGKSGWVWNGGSLSIP